MSYWCEHPSIGIDNVTGNIKARSCSSMRTIGTCGVEGALFDPKPHWWQRFLPRAKPQ